MTPTLYCTHFDSPVGPLTLVSDGRALVGLHFDVERPRATRRDVTEQPEAAPFALAREQLAQYFAGVRRDFELPLRLEGTDFQQRVWAALQRIPFGATRSYGELAARLGKPKAMRAVGLANGRNPIAIIVPCHRVIGADGSLTGFGGGLERKEWLLAHEGARALALPLSAAMGTQARIRSAARSP